MVFQDDLLVDQSRSLGVSVHNWEENKTRFERQQWDQVREESMAFSSMYMSGECGRTEKPEGGCEQDVVSRPDKAMMGNCLIDNQAERNRYELRWCGERII